LEKRKELLPIVTRVFAEHGYRRTTTAELAERCGVRENILYRLWSDKKAMFIAAIDYVYRQSARIWQDVERQEASADGGDGAARLLQYEAEHGGQFGLYRIVFAGLSEADDPEIRAALRNMYKRFQRFIQRRAEAHRGDGQAGNVPDVEMSAWALVGLGTVANICRQLGLMGEGRRQRLMLEVGALLLDGRTAGDGVAK
jgi:AcrR family transcriptional regulator